MAVFPFISTGAQTVSKTIYKKYTISYDNITKAIPK